MIAAIPKNFSEQKAYRKQITNANIPVLLLCGYLFTSQRKLILIIRPIPMANMKNPTAFRSVNHMFPLPVDSGDYTERNDSEYIVYNGCA